MDLSVETSIRAIEQVQWDLCFRGDVESWAYYLAVEESDIPGFEWRYFTLRDSGRLLAAVPAFITEYRLETTAQGHWKRWIGRLNGIVPNLMSLRMICFGSPVTEICQIGFAPGLCPERREKLLRRLFDGLERYAAQVGISLMAIKDVAAADVDLVGQCLKDRYHRLAGLPTAVLPLPFADSEAYLRSLSRATRKDMRRKLRAATGIVIERSSHIDAVLPEVAALYDETHGRSELQFEYLPPAYFANVLKRLGDRASCFLYRHAGELVAFNIVLHNRERLVDKFLGMRQAVARQYNLYFLSWMTNVEYCLANGIPLYQSGQALYEPKRRLGSRMVENHIFFRHRNSLVNGVLRVAGRLLHPTDFDTGNKVRPREAA